MNLYLNDSWDIHSQQESVGKETAAVQSNTDNILV